MPDEISAFWPEKAATRGPSMTSPALPGETAGRYTVDGVFIPDAPEISVRADESQEAELFDRNWGNPFPKEELDGQVISIVGLQSAPDFGVGPCMAVLFRLDSDTPDLAPWGILLSADGIKEDGSRSMASPLVGHAVSHFKRHSNPLRGRAVRKASKTKGHNDYWDLVPPSAPWPPEN